MYSRFNKQLIHSGSWWVVYKSPRLWCHVPCTTYTWEHDIKACTLQVIFSCCYRIYWTGHGSINLIAAFISVRNLYLLLHSLFLRFWVNLIKNPDFLFDINKSATVDSCFTVVAQAYIDACSTADTKYSKDTPSARLLYASEVGRYKTQVLS